MINLVKRLHQSLPTFHLIAATACILAIGITLMLLPSERVEATRSSQPLALKASPDQSTASEAEQDVDRETAKLVAQATEPDDTPLRSENWVEYKVQANDTLTSLFKRAGLSARDVYYVSQASKALNTLKRGETFAFLIEGGELVKLKRVLSPLKSTLISLQDDGSYKAEDIELDPRIEQVYAEGTINNSLFYDASAAGMPDYTIMQLANLFGWDIDFALDIRKGDQFRVIYEEKWLDGKKLGTGNILAAQFVNRGETFTAIRYTDSEGNSNYYTPQGNSMRKAFIRSPVDFTRISSRFNPGRKHPVLNKIRAHKGVDYAARTGTPIKAAGDGKIIFRGKKGGYGNVIILQHGGNITTRYAHMSKFKAGLHVGSRVKQSQVIGYVGMSGLATGPHLHYEFRVNGVHKDPIKVKLPHASPVKKAERAHFKQISQSMMAMLDGYAAGRGLAKAE